ncbi:hypothetical protein LEQ06_20505, partial [Paraclostridium sp. AKS46]|nr:hypothetical protein [Paraclostridium sp. AKS46]
MKTAPTRQRSLGQQLPASLLIMVLISILLFGKLRQPLIVWLLVPMAVQRSGDRSSHHRPAILLHRASGAAVTVGDVAEERHRIGRGDRS